MYNQTTRLPKKIVATRSVTYNVENIMMDMFMMDQMRTEQPDLEEILDWIGDMLPDDLYSESGVVQLTDEDGEFIRNWA